ASPPAELGVYLRLITYHSFIPPKNSESVSAGEGSIPLFTVSRSFHLPTSRSHEFLIGGENGNKVLRLLALARRLPRAHRARAEGCKGGGDLRQLDAGRAVEARVPRRQRAGRLAGAGPRRRIDPVRVHGDHRVPGRNASGDA